MIAYELGAVPRVFVGRGAVDRLPEIVGGLGASSALLVVDQAVAATGWSARVAATFREDVAVVEHLVPPGEPTVASVDAAADAARRLDGVVVVGIGGGSALDTAKQAAVVCTAAVGVSHYLLGVNAFAGRRPIVAIPTTSGTGAEVTRTCILSDAQGRKMWTWGDEMLPDARHPRPDGNGVDAAACHRLHGARRARPRDRGVHRATTEPALHSGRRCMR